MVRVPGSSGDSQGFHRESTEEDVKIKTEPGNESTTEDGSPPTALKTPGPTDHQSVERSSDDAKEECSAMDLGEKPQTPRKTEAPYFTKTPPASRSTSKKKKSKASRKKLKAPESEAKDQEHPQVWTNDLLVSAFHYKSLYRLMHDNPVMKILRLNPIGELQGSVKEPRDVFNKHDAVKILMRMLKEAGIVLGSLDEINRTEPFPTKYPYPSKEICIPYRRPV